MHKTLHTEDSEKRDRGFLDRIRAAFPTTLRDYFAAHAPVALLRELQYLRAGECFDDMGLLAPLAWTWADEMLSQREPIEKDKPAASPAPAEAERLPLRLALEAEIRRRRRMIGDPRYGEDLATAWRRVESVFGEKELESLPPMCVEALEALGEVVPLYSQPPEATATILRVLAPLPRYKQDRVIRAAIALLGIDEEDE